MKTSFIIFIALSFLLSPLYSNAAEYERWLKIAKKQLLHESLRWQRILHYSQSHNSHVGDPRFFISPLGMYDPEAELLASIDAFFTEENAPIRCRFPARVRFLGEALEVRKPLLSLDHCKEYSEWRAKHDIQKVWLIFPSAFLNSPSSMFGHTLIRLDSENTTDKTELMTQAVNYAATINEGDGGLLYAYKGIFGGYPGYFSMMPYYEKVKEYSRMENRDIWEYQLNLTEDEIDWLLRHLWELNEIRFDYLFASKNCSYQLLALFDAVRINGPTLTKGFEHIAIPVETVRRFHKHGWVIDIHYRASKSTEFYQKLKGLKRSERGLVINLRKKDWPEVEDQLDTLSSEKRRQILEAAYKLLRLEDNSSIGKKRALKLLNERSKLGKAVSIYTEPDPLPPESGHESHRIALGLIGSEQETYGLLDFKMAYHGLDDNSEAFPPGVQINFMHGLLFFDEEHAQLEFLDVIDIRSLAASDRFINRLAWQVNTGWKRRLFEGDEFEIDERGGQRELVKQVGAEAGRVYQLGILKPYLLVGAQAELHRWYSPNFAIGPSVELGIFYQTASHSMELRYEYDHFIEESLERQRVHLMTNWKVSRNWSVNLSAFGEQVQNDDWYSTSLQVNRYF